MSSLELPTNPYLVLSLELIQLLECYFCFDGLLIRLLFSMDFLFIHKNYDFKA